MKKGRKKHRGGRQAISMLIAPRRQNGSNRRRYQWAGHEKKKHAVGKDRRRGGHEVPRGFELRSLDSESRVLTVTPRDQLMEVTGRVN